MKKSESVETITEKYKRIFWDEFGNSDFDLTNFLIEFAGAVEHHLSTELTDEDGMANLIKNQQDMPPEFSKAVDDNFDKLI